jgi:hypothetical protein
MAWASGRTFFLLLSFGALLGINPAMAQDTQPMQPMKEQMMMGGMAVMGAPVIPAVLGYADGEQILFLHTETSDPKIAKILTDMMESPVLVVPSLAAAPEDMLARVYVFTNDIQPDGPRGPLDFQPDVFDAPPGSTGYSPLRAVTLVTWKEEAQASLLTSATEVEAAIQRGEITIAASEVVVNMPFVTWPGGER